LRDAWSGAWHEACGSLDAEEVARRKTGSLFRLACELGALAARAPAGQAALAARYGSHVGLAYQCADDLHDGGAGSQRLGARARAELGAARATALAFPPGPHRAALAEAPRAIVGRAWPPLAEAAP
jgi:farnesyl diphosphate synthase